MEAAPISSRRARGTSLVLAFLLATAAILAAAAPLARQHSGHAGQAIVGLVTSLGTFALTWAVTKWERLRLSDVGAAVTSGSAMRFGTGFVAGLVLVAAWAALTFAAGHVRWGRTIGVPPQAAAMALLAYLALACREELAFRTYPLRRLAGMYGPLTAQVVIALVFALEHVAGGNSWTNALLGAGVGALLFGTAALATRGIAVPLGLHAAWNLGRWCFGGWDIPGYLRPVVEPGYERYVDRTGLAAYVAVMLAATAACWWIGRSRSGLIAAAARRPVDR